MFSLRKLYVSSFLASPRERLHNTIVSAVSGFAPLWTEQAVLVNFHLGNKLARPGLVSEQHYTNSERFSFGASTTKLKLRQNRRRSLLCVVEKRNLLQFYSYKNKRLFLNSRCMRWVQGLASNPCRASESWDIMQPMVKYCSRWTMLSPLGRADQVGMKNV